MQRLLIILFGTMICGCAAQSRTSAPRAMAPVEPELASAALVFDPPTIQSERPLNLSRTGRGEAAFAGFENSSTSYFDVYTDNRQTTDHTDRFERDSYSEHVGSITR